MTYTVRTIITTPEGQRTIVADSGCQKLTLDNCQSLFQETKPGDLIELTVIELTMPPKLTGVKECIPQLLTTKQCLALWHRLHLKFNSQERDVRRMSFSAKDKTLRTDPQTIGERTSDLERELYLMLTERLKASARETA